MSFILCFICGRQRSDLFGHLDLVIAPLEGYAPLKIPVTPQTAKMSPEALVLEPPLGTAKRPAAAVRTAKVHLLFIYAGVFEIADVVVLEGQALIKALVAGMQIYL